jgi:hypothetical protein
MGREVVTQLTAALTALQGHRGVLSSRWSPEPRADSKRHSDEARGGDRSISADDPPLPI